MSTERYGQINDRSAGPISPPVAASIAPPSQDKAERFSKTVLISMWSAVGIFAVACVLFLMWYSHSSHQAKIAAANERISQAVATANERISQAVATANEWMTNNSRHGGETVERQLTEALASEHVTEKANGEAVLNEVRQRRGQLVKQACIAQAERQARAVFNDAKRRIEERHVTEAIALLRKCVADPDALDKAEAQSLLTEAEIAVSDMLTLDALEAMDDETFDGVKATGTINDGKVTHPVLVAVRNETVKRNVPKDGQRREDIRLAEEKRRDAERLAAEKQREAEHLAVSERRRNNEFNIGDVPFSTALANFRQLYPNAINSAKSSELAIGVTEYIIHPRTVDSVRFEFVDERLVSITMWYRSENLSRFGDGDGLLARLKARFGEPDSWDLLMTSDEIVYWYTWNKGRMFEIHFTSVPLDERPIVLRADATIGAHATIEFLCAELKAEVQKRKEKRDAGL